MGNPESAFDNREEGESWPPDSESEEAEFSLSGKGWDILVGGADNVAALGGPNPFDIEGGQADDLSELLAAGATEGHVESVAAEVFYDRGRGAEMPEPPDVTEAFGSGPPRDLSPEELGAAPVVMGAGQPVMPPPPPAAGRLDDLGVDMPAMPPISELTRPPIVDGPTLPAQPSPVVPGARPAPAPEAPRPTGPRPFAPADTTPRPFAPSTGPFGAPAEPAMPDIPPAVPPVVRPAAEAPSMRGARVLPATFSRPDDPFIERPVARPVTPEMEPHDELEAALITPDRINALWDEINETYALVIGDVRGYYNATDTAIADLKKAREYLLAGTEYFDNAEELVKRVKARLRLENKVRQWSRSQGAWLGVYLVLWLILLFTAFLLTNRIDAIVRDLVPDWLAAGVMPGLFGSVGGVVGALWVLIKHIAKRRDFDPIHAPWYIVNPFMGMALGVITYFLVFATGSVLGAEMPSTPQEIEGTGLYGLYAVCTIVGFKQNVLWALVDRVSKAIAPQEEIRPTVEEESSNESSG